MSGTRLTDALAGVPPAPLAEAVIPLASPDDRGCGEKEVEEEEEEDAEEEEHAATGNSGSDEQDGEQADEEGDEDDGSPPAKKPRINCKGMAFVLTFVLYCIALLSASPQQQRYLQHQQ